MARAITSDELLALRSDGQWSKLYLAIHVPNTIYAARLNGVPSANDRVYQITYDGGVGTLADVKVGMTLYVGTSAGAHDLGMCRIRKTPGASTFYIGLTSEITWADNCYLTVVDEFDLWAKHATITSAVLAMDVDVAYSDQHASFAPVPVLGPPAVVWLDAASVDVVFDASDSWVLGSSISAYAWSAPGAASIVDDTTFAPTITYDTAGCYAVYGTVTAANGKSTTGVRHVFVYDRVDHLPATVFQLAQCIGDHDSGGWMFDMTMEAEASLSEIRDRALVVLFAEDWYGGTQQEIGPVAGRENIVCVGRIVGESIRWDRESGLVHFTVQGMQHWLSKLKAFPVDLSFVGAAAAWDEMPALTVDRVLWHILQWHSTAIETLDFYPSNDTRYTADGKTIASTIWGQLADIAFSKIFAVPGVDRFGRLFVEVDPQMVPEVDRDFPVVMDLTSDDWVEALDFGRVIVPECALISLNAEEVNSAGTPVTRYSLSPGHVPLRYGEPEMLEHALCASQAQANQLAGLLLGWRNNPYPDVPANLAMNNRMIDVFPRQTCGFVMATTDTPREVALDTQLLPRRVAFYFDGDTGYMHSEINYEAETAEQINTNGDIPDTDALSMEIPPIPDLPSLPDLPILLPGTLGTGTPSVGPRRVLVHDTTAGLLYSANFNSTSPTWLQVNAGLTTAQYQSINKIVVCPNGAVYVAFLTSPTFTNSFIARAPYIGATFTVILTQADITGITGVANSLISDIACNPLAAEEVVYVLNASTGLPDPKYFYHGVGGTFTAGAVVTAGGNPAAVSYGLGQWLLTTSGVYYRLNSTASAVVSNGTITDGDSGSHGHVRVNTTGTTFINRSDNAILLGTNNCAVVAELNPSNIFRSLTVAVDGVLLAAVDSTPNAKKSSDGGASFSTISLLPVLQSWAFAYVNGAGASSCWIAVSDGGYIYYTDSFWVNTPLDKRGNVASLTPLPHLNIVKVIAL